MCKQGNETELVNVSVIIPMYNEGKVVQELYVRVKNVIAGVGKNCEIIFIDDGSTDETFKELKKIQEKDRCVRLIKLRGNFGQTAALAAGFDHARGEIMIALDGDLQHFPEDIPNFLKKMDEGYDIVSGWRENRKDPFFSRRFPSKIANWLMAKISGISLRDFGTTFKAYRREVIEELNLYGQFHRFIPVLASPRKVRIAEIPIQNEPQKYRKSHYNITRTFTVFFDLIRLNFLNKFFTRPLQIFGTLGLTMDFVGACITFYLIYLKYAKGLGLLEYRAPLFLLAILLIITGILFIILGLIGEMIVKLFHDLTKGKIYSVDKIYQS